MYIIKKFNNILIYIRYIKLNYKDKYKYINILN